MQFGDAFRISVLLSVLLPLVNQAVIEDPFDLLNYGEEYYSAIFDRYEAPEKNATQICQGVPCAAETDTLCDCRQRGCVWRSVLHQKGFTCACHSVTDTLASRLAIANPSKEYHRVSLPMCLDCLHDARPEAEWNAENYFGRMMDDRTLNLLYFEDYTRQSEFWPQACDTGGKTAKYTVEAWMEPTATAKQLAEEVRLHGPVN